MPVNIWTAGVKEVYIGNQKVQEVYIGNQKVYGAVSYKYVLEFNNYDDLNDFDLWNSQRRNFIIENGNLSFASRNGIAEAELSRVLQSGEELSIKVKVWYWRVRLRYNNFDAFDIYIESSQLIIELGGRSRFFNKSYKDEWLTVNAERGSTDYKIEVFDGNSEKIISRNFRYVYEHYPKLFLFSSSSYPSLIDYIRFR